jgi:hypothetical protein
MLANGTISTPEEIATPNDAIKDPYVLEFLYLMGQYSESDLEQALIQRLEDFLSSSVTAPRSSGDSAGCASTRPGIDRTCSSFIDACAVSCSSI